ncbi:A/G-specific adenine glycosylase [bacterium]|nr:A/G-specific adenine glycosylase [bacterium]
MTAPPSRRQATPHPASTSTRLLAWYDDDHRDLPWRTDDPDPYRVWVSEIMLQQTRVDTVLRYYDRFLTAFPDVHSLAAADDDTLLLQWEGLGYYRRARNLRDGAKAVASEWLDVRNRWPRTAAEWRTLPGVGAYTAAALASICANEPAAVVDGNVKRVLARLYGLASPINTSAGHNVLQQRADELIPTGRPGDHNQALMELGAVVCTPRSPRCGSCPLQEACVAFRDSRTAELPVKRPKPAVPHHHVAAAVIRNPDGALLIQRRPDDGMLGGLWELPSVMLPEGTSWTDHQPDTGSGPDCLRERVAGLLGTDTFSIGPAVAQARHAYSHFSVEVRAYPVDASISSTSALTGDTSPGLAWLTVNNRTRFALHKVQDKLVRAFWDDQLRL